jgi:hypothetical protein
MDWDTQEPDVQEPADDGYFDAEPSEPQEPEETVEEPQAPEAPPVSPDWLDEAAAPAQAVQDYGRQPQYQQQQYPQQYAPQQPQVQPQMQQPGQVMSEDMLEAFVRDPNGYVNRLVQAQVEQAIGPAAMTAMQAASGVSSFIHAQAETGIGEAKKAISSAYKDVFNQDETFRSNQDLQRRVGGSLQALLEQAAYKARSGDFSDLAMFRSFGEQQARATLAAAKALAGITGRSESPMSVAGAVVESPVARASRDDVQLSAEEEDVISARSRVEPGYRDRYIAAKKEAIKRGDFTF